MRFKHKKKDEIINVSNVRLVYTDSEVLHIDPSGQYNLSEYDVYPMEDSGDYSSVAVKKNPNDRHY
ncbi:MAG: hypothetical protein Unbinned4388contig1000_18 [Prokaryotic dsDNA virus sp.]|nr:MAG: hypothetical protein Unbinned4388contig1000_18 [Prokaryotic dsDNA virus sp.]|tara:strand:+ start:122 stop:319 length:198 start_codon:yes stop_codon:yes gene_type:complete